MTFELNSATLFAIAVAFVGALWALLKLFAVQHEKALETRFKGLSDSMELNEKSLEARFKALDESVGGIRNGQEREQETNQRLERELLQFKAEVARDRVHREDFIRAVGTIETKIDNMALRVERAMINSRSGSDK